MAKINANYEAVYILNPDLTEEQIARSVKETALQNEYMSAAYQVYTAKYEGKEWDNATLEQALADGELDQETYTVISRAIAKNQNAALGDIYLRMVALRQEIAASYDYDNYADYAYTDGLSAGLHPGGIPFLPSGGKGEHRSSVRWTLSALLL